jgi:hypothetical protein
MLHILGMDIYCVVICAVMLGLRLVERLQPEEVPDGDPAMLLATDDAGPTCSALAANGVLSTWGILPPGAAPLAPSPAATRVRQSAAEREMEVRRRPTRYSTSLRKP